MFSSRYNYKHPVEAVQRPLCEQVVGRALRRKSYALNEETQMFAEYQPLPLFASATQLPFLGLKFPFPADCASPKISRTHSLLGIRKLVSEWRLDQLRSSTGAGPPLP